MNELYCHYAEYAKFPEHGMDRYLEHNERIKQAVPKDRLLVFNVKQGWEPLCSFLEKPVPQVPFPRGNSTEEVLGIIQRGFALTDSIVARKLVWITTFAVMIRAVVYSAGCFVSFTLILRKVSLA